MSTSSATLAAKDNPVKVSFASMIGSAVESYDFFIYGTAAAGWFGKIFFHTNEPIIGILAAFATLAVGFLMRPFGGYLAGSFRRSSGPQDRAVLVAARNGGGDGADRRVAHL